MSSRGCVQVSGVVKRYFKQVVQLGEVLTLAPASYRYDPAPWQAHLREPGDVSR